MGRVAVSSLTADSNSLASVSLTLQAVKLSIKFVIAESSWDEKVTLETMYVPNVSIVWNGKRRHPHT